MKFFTSSLQRQAIKKIIGISQTTPFKKIRPKTEVRILTGLMPVICNSMGHFESSLQSAAAPFREPVDVVREWCQIAIMMSNALLEEKSEEAVRRPKNFEDLVWVQCSDHRCLAFADETGHWINFYTGKILTDFIRVIG